MNPKMRIRPLRSVRSAPLVALWALPLLLFLPHCADQMTPGPTPSGDTEFQGNFNPGSGELVFRVDSPSGEPEPFLRLVATEVQFDIEGLLHARVAIRNTGNETVPGPSGVLVSHFQPDSVHPDNAMCPLEVPGDSTDPGPRRASGVPRPGASPADSVPPEPPIPPLPPPIEPPPGTCFFDHRGTYGEDGLLAGGETSTPVEWIFAGTGGQSFAFHASLVVEFAPPDGVIGGVVFQDQNENGQRDLDEPGIPGVGVGLQLPDQVHIVVTDERGRYGFDVPDAGLYTVTMTVPEGGRPTTPTELQVLIVRQNDGTLSSFLAADFGLVRTVLPELFVEGFVFFDHDRDGERDRADEGVAQVQILASALECMLPVTGVAFTDTDGHYLIRGQSVGCPLPWLVARQPVPGYVGTTPDQVILDKSAGNGTLLRVDFGIATEDSTNPVNLTIEGHVFFDADQNGVFDPGEAGLPSAELQLLSPCDVFRGTTTDASGYYVFPPLVTRTCPVTGVWQWMPTYPQYTTANPVPVELPPLPPGNHLLRVDIGVFLRRR